MKKWAKYSEDELKKIYLSSNSYKDFFLKIGYKSYNSSMVNEVLERYSWFVPIILGKKNLIGERFGRLKVVGQAKSINGHRRWNCLCDCGEMNFGVATSDLKNGRVLSCGCLAREKTSERCLIDLTGQKINRWIVLKRDKNQVNKGTYWICRCLNCGQEKSVNGESLRNGTSTNCGCEKSRGERWIKTFLEEKSLSFIQQYSISELKGINGGKLSFDFFLPERQICIEYQGIQHYEPIEFFGGEARYNKQKENDELKRQFCNLNKLQLIEVPYFLLEEQVYKLLEDSIKTG